MLHNLYERFFLHDWNIILKTSIPSWWEYDRFSAHELANVPGLKQHGGVASLSVKENTPVWCRILDKIYEKKNLIRLNEYNQLEKLYNIVGKCKFGL